MLAKLAKIANRLDSLGLTKEADILDSYLLKVTAAQEYGENYRDLPTQIANEISSGNPSISKEEFKKKFIDSFVDIKAPASSNPSQNLVQSIRNNAEIWAEKMWQSPSSSRGASYPVSEATGWEKYVSTTGAMGQKVKEAWSRYSYSGAAGLNPSFSSFTSWYNGQMKGAWGGKHKSPEEIIKILNERATANAMAGSHYEASAPGESDKRWERELSNPWGLPNQVEPSSEDGSRQAFRGEKAEELGYVAPEWAKAENLRENLPHGSDKPLSYKGVGDISKNKYVGRQ